MAQKVRVAENKWFWRRTAVLLTLAMCFVMMLAILLLGEDTALNRDAFSTLAFLFGSTLFAYLGWATGDDAWVLHKLGERAFAETTTLESPPADYPSDIVPPEGYAS